MNPSAHSLMALLMGTVSIAALHALIPSHWLAFAVVARARQWTLRRTLLVTLLAGGGHILLTIALGIVVMFAGKTLLRTIPPQVEHAATGGLLIALGVYFVVSCLRGGQHHHHHHAHDERLEEVTQEATRSDSLGRLGQEPTVMGALVLGMTLSPCLDLLSVFVAASAMPWHVVILVSACLAVTTLGLMLLLVWLTTLGLQRLRLYWLEHNEGLIIGVALIALGALLFFLH